MALIALADFKDVLGVGDIYPDATLESVMSAAEAVVIPFLSVNRAGLSDYSCLNGVATFWTTDRNLFRTGQAVTISGVGAHYNGNKTVIDWGDRYFTVAVDHVTTHDLTPIWPAGYAILSSQVDLYDMDERARQAALMIAVDIWHSRVSASGVAEAVDFTPGPWRMGRSLYSRVAGLLQGIRDPRGMVG